MQVENGGRAVLNWEHEPATHVSNEFTIGSIFSVKIHTDQPGRGADRRGSTDMRKMGQWLESCQPPSTSSADCPQHSISGESPPPLGSMSSHSDTGDDSGSDTSYSLTSMDPTSLITLSDEERSRMSPPTGWGSSRPASQSPSLRRGEERDHEGSERSRGSRGPFPHLKPPSFHRIQLTLPPPVPMEWAETGMQEEEMISCNSLSSLACQYPCVKLTQINMAFLQITCSNTFLATEMAK